jgi:hypothetical protein
VVEGHDESMVIIVQPDKPATVNRAFRQIEWLLGFLIDQLRCIGRHRPLFDDVRQRRVLDDLHRSAILDSKHGPQHFMPGVYLLQRALQCVSIELALQSESDWEVQQCAGPQLLDEP